MNEKEPDDFDLFAENYREIHTKNIRHIAGAGSNYFAAYKVAALSEFEVNREIRVLDVGCGDGATEFFFQQYFPDFEITGIDVSEKSLSAAKARNLGNASFLVYNGVDFPFSNETFDFVFIAGVLHHIDAALHARILTEIKRVLKKKGAVYVFEHNPLNPLTQYLVKTCVFDKNAELIRAPVLKRKMVNAGFGITNTVFTIFFPRSKFFKPFLSVEKYLKFIPLGGQYFIRAVKD